MIYSILSIILIIASLLLVTFNVLKGKWYAWLIYFSGLFTIYGTTMVGMSVVGSDISRELLMSNLALENGWDLSLYDPSNTSWVVGWFIPMLSKLTTIEPVWIYKVFLPMIFAFTPVILYFIFRKQFGELKAFYASMFFIIVPVFALEIASIGKSMVAETFMALSLWVMFNAEWKQIWKFIVMLVLVLSTLWAHYTIGILLCIYLGCIWLIMFIKSIINKDTDVKFWGLESTLFVLIICVIAFSIYYRLVAQGLIWNSVTGIFHYDFSQSFNIINKSVNPSAVVSDNVSSTVQAYSLIKSAFGFDIGELGWSGITFRIVQILTQVLIVVGFGWMIWERNYPQNGVLTYRLIPEYVAGCFVAFGLLGLCVFVPAFASLINATRQYHISLMFLAPMFVLSFDGIGVWIEWAEK